jgi:hypothetical protein
MLPVTSNHEIGKLTVAFNHMVEDLRAKAPERCVWIAISRDRDFDNNFPEGWDRLQRFGRSSEIRPEGDPVTRKTGGTESSNFAPSSGESSELEATNGRHVCKGQPGTNSLGRFRPVPCSPGQFPRRFPSGPDSAESKLQSAKF